MKVNSYVKIGISLLAFCFAAFSCNNNKDSSSIMYTITFDSDGAVFTEKPIIVNADEKIENLPDSYRNGYTFGGWFSEKGGEGIELTTHSVISENITVYAKWNNIIQYEFNPHEYSQKFKEWLFTDGYTYILAEPLGLEKLVAFSSSELRLLRNMIYAKYNYKFASIDLDNFFSKFKWYHGTEENIDNLLSENDRYNIDYIQMLEQNYPSENTLNNELVGLWRLAYGVPDQGYIFGDYIKFYKNGIFEYVFRDFKAKRHLNQIYGGSKHGLWTSNDGGNMKNNSITEILFIPEIKDKWENRIISIYDDNWWKLSDDVNYEMEWGTIR